MLKITAFSTEMGALGVIHSTNISRNFSPKLNGSVWSNRKSFEKTGPRFEVDHLIPGRKFWLNGLCPVFLIFSDNRKTFFLWISICYFQEKVISCEFLHIKHVSKSATQLDYCIKVCSPLYHGSFTSLLWFSNNVAWA